MSGNASTMVWIAYADVWITDSITTYKNQVSASKEIFFLKKKKENLLYDTDKFVRKDFYVKDSLHNFKWTLLPDTTTILNRKCLSAKTYFRGREYTVFYAPSIPISDGPWKFGGLPGLVLEAKSKDDFIVWRAVKLNLAYKGSFEYVDVSKNKYLTWSEFIEQYNILADKFIHASRSQEESKGVKSRLQMPRIEIIHLELNDKGVLIEY